MDESRADKGGVCLGAGTVRGPHEEVELEAEMEEEVVVDARDLASGLASG